jgi:Fe-S cluster biosynthesis and repair protein YggX
MSRTVFCLYLKKEAEGLDFPPYPGELGQKIFDSISKEAWAQWIGRQTMLINECRLSLVDPKSTVLLREEMAKFLFGEGV